MPPDAPPVPPDAPWTPLEPRGALLTPGMSSLTILNHPGSSWVIFEPFGYEIGPHILSNPATLTPKGIEAKLNELECESDIFPQNEGQSRQI